MIGQHYNQKDFEMRIENFESNIFKKNILTFLIGLRGFLYYITFKEI